MLPGKFEKMPVGGIIKVGKYSFENPQQGLRPSGYHVELIATGRQFEHRYLRQLLETIDYHTKSQINYDSIMTELQMSLHNAHWYTKLMIKGRHTKLWVRWHKGNWPTPPHIPTWLQHHYKDIMDFGEPEDFSLDKPTEPPGPNDLDLDIG